MPSLLLELTQMLLFYFCSLLVAHRGHNDFRSRVACHVWDGWPPRPWRKTMCVFGAPRLFDKRCRSAIGPRPRTTAIHYHTGNSERRPLPARGYHHLNGCGTPTFGLRV